MSDKNDGNNVSRFCLLGASSDPFKYSWDDNLALFLIELFPPSGSMLELKPGIHHNFVSRVPLVVISDFLPAAKFDILIGSLTKVCLKIKAVEKCPIDWTGLFS